MLERFWESLREDCILVTIFWALIFHGLDVTITFVPCAFCLILGIVFFYLIAEIVFPKHTADCLFYFWFSLLSNNKKVSSRF